MELQEEKQLTANQLYKQYKDDGGKLTFSEWLNREKAKGVYPLNSTISNDIIASIEKLKKEEKMNKTILGFPVSVLVITGLIIVGAVVYTKYKK